ncbi:uncharacterized protein LOC114728515 [Neltuma alba]|uniref:uncharacterized protein LOC114728515 n=1 Tax=Neltuma alba TaxID=207710 RepID=UPI0010A3D3EE|nr:uncharacterized protein LOC114728515 [Prosopis alba]
MRSSKNGTELGSGGHTHHDELISPSPSHMDMPLALNALDIKELVPSVVQPPDLELKPLPSNLKYVFLAADSKLPVIISSSLSSSEEERLDFYHAAVRYLFKKPQSKPRLLRWALLLQEFDIEIRDRAGAENHVADHLSRLPEGTQGVDSSDLVIDSFPDSALLPWLFMSLGTLI